MKANSSYKDLSNKFPVLNKLVSFRSFCLVLALIFISLGVVGGCSNNDNGNGEPDVVTLGAHRNVALEDIGESVDLAPHTGEVNNIILDGTSLVTLTQEEIGLIREAYDKGFILFVYEATDKDIVRIYRNIIGHPFRHAELESLDGIPEGNMHALFTLEQHEGLDWSGTAQFTKSATRVLLEGEEDDLVPSDPQGAFSAHGFHISE